MTDRSLSIKKVELAQPAAIAAAQELAHRGRFDEALAALNAALWQNPELAPAHLLTGMIRWRRGDASGAREALELAAKLDSKSVEAWRALARVCSELAEHRAALAAIDEALRHEKDRAEDHLLRGQILIEIDRPRRASKALGRALKLKPTLAPAHFSLARLAFRQGQKAAALARIEAALQLGALPYESLFEAGQMLVELDRREEAIAVYRRLMREFPLRGAPYVKLAELFIERGHEISALPLLSIAVKLEPKNTDAYRLLAVVSRLESRDDTAREMTYAARSFDSKNAPVK